MRNGKNNKEPSAPARTGSQMSRNVLMRAAYRTSADVVETKKCSQEDKGSCGEWNTGRPMTDSKSDEMDDEQDLFNLKHIIGKNSSAQGTGGEVSQMGKGLVERGSQKDPLQAEMRDSKPEHTLSGGYFAIQDNKETRTGAFRIDKSL